MVSLKVSNDNVKYNSDNTVLTSSYTYQNSIVSKQGETYTVKPFTKDYEFQVNFNIFFFILFGCGWDINGENLQNAAKRAKVLSYDLQSQLGSIE
ncbi:unnamed protein product [Wickerhamomyces anomalus]